jgi:hypothetical protein
MYRTYFWIVTGIGEGATGLFLLLLPSVPLALLIGVQSAAIETILVSRLAGVALIAIGIACWFARNDYTHSADCGLLTGLLIYNVGAAGLLAYAGAALNLVGLALWPAVVLHAGLAIWCIFCFSVKPRGAAALNADQTHA